MEKWKNIKGYEGLYKISNKGRIKSLKRKYRLNDIILKQHHVKDLYCYVTLSKKNINYQVTIHRMLAETFIPNPFNKTQINHINGIKYDNRLDNLEWVTASENTQHAINNGLFTTCVKVVQLKNGVEIKTFNSMRDASRISEIESSSISRCCNGILKSAGGYNWELYKEVN